MSLDYGQRQHNVVGCYGSRLCENSPNFGVDGTALHIEQILNVIETWRTTIDNY